MIDGIKCLGQMGKKRAVQWCPKLPQYYCFELVLLADILCMCFNQMKRLQHAWHISLQHTSMHYTHLLIKAWLCVCVCMCVHAYLCHLLTWVVALMLRSMQLLQCGCWTHHGTHLLKYDLYGPNQVSSGMRHWGNGLGEYFTSLNLSRHLSAPP